MNKDIEIYNKTQVGEEKKVCTELARIIDSYLKKSDSKIWYRHPVWFLDGNPIVGYVKLKAGIRLMFWSGRSFDESLLIPSKGRFKDSSITYTNVSELVEKDLKRWLKKAVLIQWDYKNIVKRKGKLIKLTSWE